jgi:hypothetical protein
MAESSEARTIRGCVTGRLRLSPAQCDQVRATLIHRADHHPLARHWAGLCQSVPHWRNTEGWHARAEQLVTISLIARFPHVPGWTVMVPPGQDPAHLALMVAAAMDTAQPYLWRVNAQDTALAASDPPRCIIDRTLLPYPVMDWSLETARVVTREDIVEKKQWPPSVPAMDMNWILVVDTGIGYCLFNDLASDTERRGMLCWGGKCQYGTTWPDDYTGSARQHVGTSCACWHFFVRRTWRPMRMAFPAISVARSPRSMAARGSLNRPMRPGRDAPERRRRACPGVRIGISRVSPQVVGVGSLSPAVVSAPRRTGPSGLRPT